VETKLIELYLLICRLYDTRPVLKQQRLSNNHQPLFPVMLARGTRANRAREDSQAIA
jgi:hypothetical protein